MMATNENAASVFFLVPRPQDGTLDFSLEPAFLAAVATSGDSSWEFSTAASFNTAVRGSDAATRASFPRLVHKTTHWISVRVLRLLSALLQPPTTIWRTPVLMRGLILPLEGAMLLISLSVLETYQNQPHLLLLWYTYEQWRPTRRPPFNRDTSVVDTRSPSAHSARRMPRHTLTIAVHVAEAQTATVATAAPVPYDAETRRTPPPLPRGLPLLRYVSPVPAAACHGRQIHGERRPPPSGLPAG